MATTTTTEGVKQSFRSRLIGLSVWALLSIAMLAIVLLLVTSVRLILFSSNDHFTLREVKLECPPITDSEAIIDNLNQQGIIPKEENLYRIDLKKVRKMIEDDFTVKKAEVRRVNPGTLSIKVHSRVPVAQFDNGSQVFLVDREGKILPYRGKDLSLLPKIKDRSDDKLQAGAQVEGGHAAEMLKFINLYDTQRIIYKGSPLFASDVFKPMFIMYVAPDMIRVVLNAHPKYGIRRGINLRLNAGDLEQSLENAVRATLKRAEDGGSISKIDATTGNRVTF